MNLNLPKYRWYRGTYLFASLARQVNVMMDGSRKVSLRNKQFVRKIEIPMPVASSWVKPSQFVGSQQDDVAGCRTMGLGVLK